MTQQIDFRKSIHAYRGDFPPASFNLSRYCLAGSADSHPDKPALIVVGGAEEAQTEVWTYGQLRTAVLQVAAGLLARGLRPGDRVMIRLPNTSTYALLFFGAIAAGLVAIPTSSQLTEEEALFLCRDAAPALLIEADAMRIADIAIPSLGDRDLPALLAHAPCADFAQTEADDPAFLIYTSGTSGRPKGVLHAQRSAWGRRPMYQGWYGISAADTILHAGAFNWTYTLGVGLMDPWANGATTVVYTGPRDPAIWPHLMEQHQATLFAAVPSVYRQILKYGDVSAIRRSPLRHGLTAGEALSPDLLAAWHKETGLTLCEALGMSECSTYISTAPDMPQRIGSPGKPQPGRSIAILPELGTEPLGPGNVGLLAVHRSDPGLMLGYWNRPDEEAEVYRGEWFCGGDLAELDEEGYLWFHGRADDIMNAMGYRVAPAEVEAVLAAHPAVAEVAVTELRVRADVSVIAAFIVARDADEADAGALLDHCRQHLAAYKCPREVVFLDTLPRTANGKVIRRALAARFGHTA